MVMSGMGEIYRATDTRLGRDVTLKVLPEGFALDSQRVTRLEREIKLLASLNHPNICTIHEITEADGRHFMVMELLEGRTLDLLLFRSYGHFCITPMEMLNKDALKDRFRNRATPIEQLLDHGIEIADGLDAAHTLGVIHSDIKPNNIFITNQGHAKVLNFGLSSVERRETRGASLTAIAYMSPEQVLRQELDLRTDLFSLGAVLYEMATCRMPFIGETCAKVLDWILHDSPPAPVRFNPEVPPELERIISKALEKDRALRYQSAADLGTDLRQLKRRLGYGLSPAPTEPA
jgi:serine/threonine protein kinase